jgi:hypothetical protein
MSEITNTPAGRVMLRNVRLSFPALWKAEAFKPGDDPKFKATFLIPKDDPQIKVIEAAILRVLKEKKQDKAAAILKGIRGNSNKFCFQDGDTKSYDGYADHMALSAKSSTRPTILDGNKSPLAEEDGKPYAGCYVNASVDVFYYNSQGDGISASLRGVQFVRDGDSFSAGRPADSDEFEEVAEGAEAGDFA